MNGADEFLLSRAVAERPPNFTDEDVEIRIHDVGIRPDSCLEPGLVEDLWPALDEGAEQVERLGRQVNVRGAAKELACL